MQRIYVKLELVHLETGEERSTALYEVFCPLIKETDIPIAPKDVEEKALVVTSEVRQMVARDDLAIVPVGRDLPAESVIRIPSGPPPPDPQPSPPRWSRFLIAVLLLILGTAVGIFIGSRVIDSRQVPAGDGTVGGPVEVTRLVEVAVTQLVEVTHEVPVTQVSEVIVTATEGPPVPTPSPVIHTRIVEAPVVVTATPPVNTPEPTPSLTLPFFDDFEDGLDPSWNVVDGDVLIDDGRLSGAGEDVTLLIGDNSLSGYDVEFDYSFPVTLFRQPNLLTWGNQLQYRFHNRDTAWLSRQNNRWVEISQGARIETTATLRVIVDGNHYQVFVNGDLFDEIIHGSAYSGPLRIRLHSETQIDNFGIDPLE